MRTFGINFCTRILRILICYLVVYLTTMPLLLAEEGFDQRQRGGGSTFRDVRSFGSKTPAIDMKSDSISFGALNPLGVETESPIFYSVHVLGEVSRPGIYRIRPSGRVTDAMLYAGGVLNNGSTRRIQLKREGTTKILDLFSYKYRGSLDQNPYLMENDVIFVPIKTGEFEIEGPVNRPGNYEITRPVLLEKAVAMAGGFSVGLSTKMPIRIVRFNSDERKEIIEVANNKLEMAKFEIKKGDVIVIPHILMTGTEFDYNLKRIPGDNIFYPTINDSVYVVGAVSMPGPYAFEPSFSVNNYVSWAGPDSRSNIKGLKIIDSNGKKKSARKTDRINPGDTIIVPTRVVTTANFVTWFGTLTSMALTTFVFIDRFVE